MKNHLQVKTISLLPSRRDVETEGKMNILRIRYLNKRPCGSKSNWLSAPKTMKMTPELTKSLGIYYAEGDKSKTRWHTRFANSEVSVISEGINLFKAFGLDETQIKGYVKTYGFDVSEEELNRHWSQETGIPLTNFIHVARYASRAEYKINRKRPPVYGRLEVYYSSVVLKDIVDNLLDMVKRISLHEENTGIDFLRGLISGEGSLKLQKGKLREARIASCSKYEQSFIRTLLKFLGIKPSDAKYKFYVAISGLGNFKRLKEIDAFQIHPEKKRLFDYGLRNLVLASGE